MITRYTDPITGAYDEYRVNKKTGRLQYRLANEDFWGDHYSTWELVEEIYVKHGWVKSGFMAFDPNDLVGFEQQSKVCDCGSLVAKTTHANWCSTNG